MKSFGKISKQLSANAIAETLWNDALAPYGLELTYMNYDINTNEWEVIIRSQLGAMKIVLGDELLFSEHVPTIETHAKLIDKQWLEWLQTKG